MEPAEQGTMIPICLYGLLWTVFIPQRNEGNKKKRLAIRPRYVSLVIRDHT